RCRTRSRCSCDFLQVVTAGHRLIDAAGGAAQAVFECLDCCDVRSVTLVQRRQAVAAVRAHEVPRVDLLESGGETGIVENVGVHAAPSLSSRFSAASVATLASIPAAMPS